MVGQEESTHRHLNRYPRKNPFAGVQQGLLRQVEARDLSDLIARLVNCGIGIVKMFVGVLLVMRQRRECLRNV